MSLRHQQEKKRVVNASRNNTAPIKALTSSLSMRFTIPLAYLLAIDLFPQARQHLLALSLFVYQAAGTLRAMQKAGLLQSK